MTAESQANLREELSRMPEDQGAAESAGSQSMDAERHGGVLGNSGADLPGALLELRRAGLLLRRRRAVRPLRPRRAVQQRRPAWAMRPHHPSRIARPHRPSRAVWLHRPSR
eukprot:13710859-Alexandrium_andersonii.AAC.1